jgi:anti-sigma factor RsiW
MNCSESHDLLQQRLDGEALADRAALERHLAQCPDCRTLHAAAGRLEEGLRHISPPVPPPGLGTAIVARALADRRARRRRRVLGGMALAASLLLAVWVGYGASGPEGRFKERFDRMLVAVGWKKAEPTNDWKPPEPLPTPPLVVASSGQSLRASMADVGTAMVALTRRTADETVEQTRILTEVLPAPMGVVFDAVPPMPEQPLVTAWQETSQRVASGFEPVATSARRALSMLLRERPRPVNQ